MNRSSQQERIKIVGLFGVGLDGSDGHRRVTRSDDFVIIGGSQDTHERMQETAIKFQESLQKRGKVLQETELHEVIELLHEAQQ